MHKRTVYPDQRNGSCVHVNGEVFGFKDSRFNPKAMVYCEQVSPTSLKVHADNDPLSAYEVWSRIILNFADFSGVVARYIAHKTLLGSVTRGSVLPRRSFFDFTIILDLRASIHNYAYKYQTNKRRLDAVLNYFIDYGCPDILASLRDTINDRLNP